MESVDLERKWIWRHVCLPMNFFSSFETSLWRNSSDRVDESTKYVLYSMCVSLLFFQNGVYVGSHGAYESITNISVKHLL